MERMEMKMKWIAKLWTAGLVILAAAETSEVHAAAASPLAVGFNLRDAGPVIAALLALALLAGGGKRRLRM